MTKHANGIVELRGAFSEAWRLDEAFEKASNVDGHIVRAIANRVTRRFELDGNGYYCKWHNGVGWGEILKNLIRLRMPVISAATEWKALNKLQELQIPCPTPLAYGVSAEGYAKRCSFIITKEIENLESVDVVLRRFNESKEPLTFRSMFKLIVTIADIARKMHLAGMNHRDFYLCHFMIDKEGEMKLAQSKSPTIYLMDLHRAQMRNEVPYRWLVKDLGGLYFSALDLGIGKRHFLRFLKFYFDADLRAILEKRRGLLSAIKKRAVRTYARDFGRLPVLPW